MSEPEVSSHSLPRRLCSEIQLFDLCERESCKCRDGRYCSDGILLERFEKITEDERHIPPDQYIDEEYCEDDADETWSASIAENPETEDGEEWEDDES